MKSTFWRTISVFISSTFADMQAERDYLKTYVFPELQEKLRSHQVSLQIIDLRMGVGGVLEENEQQRESEILKVCINEIKRSRPFFIAILGERYGWIPPKEAVERLKNSMNQIDNILLSKEDQISVTAMEIEMGAIGSNEQLPHSLFYFRDEKASAKIPAEFRPTYIEENSQSYFRLLNLKERIKRMYSQAGLTNHITEYSPQWAINRFGGLQTWGEQVKNDLYREITEYLGDEVNRKITNRYEQELINLKLFITERSKSFYGRTSFLEQIEKGIIEQRQMFLVTGMSGLGKSSLFAEIYMRLSSHHEGQIVILAHSASLSPLSRSLTHMLVSWIDQLHKTLNRPFDADEYLEQISQPEKKGGVDKSVISSKELFLKLHADFIALLGQLPPSLRPIILVDSLDSFEFSDAITTAAWIPEGVSIVMTSLPGFEEKICALHPDIKHEPLEPFDLEDARLMISHTCQENGKVLSPAILEAILKKCDEQTNEFAYTSPLWLTLLTHLIFGLDAEDFERINQDTEERIEKRIDNYILDMIDRASPRPDKLFLEILEQAAGFFGRNFCFDVVYTLALTRSGLPEDILEQLIYDWDELKFASLRRWLKGMITEQGEGHRWNFSHNILRNSIKENASIGLDYRETHTLIAKKLLERDENDALRKHETMYHLMESQDIEEALIYMNQTTANDDLAINEAVKVLVDWLLADDEKHTHGNEYLNTFYLSGLNKDDFLSRLIYRVVKSAKNDREYDLAFWLLRSSEPLFDVALSQKLTNTECWRIMGFHCKLYSLLADICQDQGNIEAALSYCEDYIHLSKKYYERFPDNEDVKTDLAKAYEDLGYKLSTVNYDQALTYFNKALEYYDEQNPASPNFDEGHIPRVYRYMVGAYPDYEQEQKIEMATKAIQQAELNVQNHPESTWYARELSLCYYIYGSMVFVPNREVYIQKCILILEKLVRTNPEEDNYRIGLADSYLAQTEISLLGADISKAKKSLERVKTLMNIEEAIAPDNFKDLTFYIRYILALSSISLIHQTDEQNNLVNGLLEAIKKYSLKASTMDEMTGSRIMQAYAQIVGNLYIANKHHEILKNAPQAIRFSYQLIQKFPTSTFFYMEYIQLYSIYILSLLEVGDKEKVTLQFKKFADTYEDMKVYLKKNTFSLASAYPTLIQATEGVYKLNDDIPSYIKWVKEILCDYRECMLQYKNNKVLVAGYLGTYITSFLNYIEEDALITERESMEDAYELINTIEDDSFMEIGLQKQFLIERLFTLYSALGEFTPAFQLMYDERKNLLVSFNGLEEEKEESLFCKTALCIINMVGFYSNLCEKIEESTEKEEPVNDYIEMENEIATYMRVFLEQYDHQRDNEDFISLLGTAATILALHADLEKNEEEKIQFEKLAEEYERLEQEAENNKKVDEESGETFSADNIDTLENISPEEAEEAFLQAEKAYEEQRYEDAFNGYTIAAMGHHIEAIHNLAYQLQHGMGCDENQEQAFQLYKRAAGEGLGKSLNKIGDYYDQGTIIPQNHATANNYYVMAIRKGSKQALSSLGLNYFLGNGVAKNEEKGEQLIRQSLEEGNQYALLLLSYILYLQERYKEALEYAQQGVNSGIDGCDDMVTEIEKMI